MGHSNLSNEKPALNVGGVSRRYLFKSEYMKQIFRYNNNLDDSKYNCIAVIFIHSKLLFFFK